jgi:hypothetical protein
MSVDFAEGGVESLIRLLKSTDGQEKKKTKKDGSKTRESLSFQKELPPEVAEAFNALPKETQDLIRYKGEDISQTIEVFDLFTQEKKRVKTKELFGIIDEEEVLKNKELVIDKFDDEGRELFISAELNGYLLAIANLRKLKQMYEFEFGRQIERLLDLLWNNRGRRGDEIKIFDQDYYDDYFSQRKVFLDKIKVSEAAIREAADEIEKTKKQKRLTESKQQLRRDLQKELDKIKETYQLFEYEWGGSVYGGKAQDEKRNQEKIAAASLNFALEYISAEDFAVLFSEGIEWLFQDNRDKAQVEKTKKKKEVAGEIINRWLEKHQADQALVKSGSKKTNKRETAKTLIEYFYKCLASYNVKKEQGDPDYGTEIIYMKNILNILKKLKKSV